MRIGKIASSADIKWIDNSKIANVWSQNLTFQIEKNLENS